MATKRSRSANFSKDEKRILVDLIYKYPILENKKIDGVTVAEKAKAWTLLTTDFNTLSAFAFRSESNLKSLWVNLKKIARQANAAEKKELFKTGGGVPELRREEDSLISKILALLGSSGEGLLNPCDGNRHSHFVKDVTEGGKHKAPNEEPVTISDTANSVVEIATSVMEEPTINWNALSSSSLRSSISVPLIIQPLEGEIINGQVDEILPSVQPQQTKVQPTPCRGRVRALNRHLQSFSRRRPYLIQNCNKEYITKKMELVEVMKTNAVEESMLNLLILNEQLKQEKIKTQLLEIELREKLK